MHSFDRRYLPCVNSFYAMIIRKTRNNWKKIIIIAFSTLISINFVLPSETLRARLFVQFEDKAVSLKEEDWGFQF